MLPHQQKSAPVNPPGVIKSYLVDAARLLAWGAYGALVYVVLVRGLQLARDTAFPLVIGKIGWADINPPIEFWFPLFPVAFALALLLPLATKYCIAFIVSIKGKDALSRWAKGILIVITLACVVSTLTATGPLMVESYSGKYREAAVNGELVEARKGAEQQIYADMQTSLQALKEGKSVEAAAAREGVAGWSAKVAIAKKQLDAGQLEQARYDRIERASSAAAAREDLERQMRDQQVKIASLPTASTAVATVKSDESHGVQDFASVASAWWPLISFFALEMIAVFFGLIQLVLEMTRDRQLADWDAVHAQPTEEAGIDMRITDGTDQWQPVPNEATYDEEGNELIPVRRRKEVHYRRKPKSKKDDAQAPIGASDPRAPAANQVELQGEDEAGADDGHAINSSAERTLGDSGILIGDGIWSGEVYPGSASESDLGRNAERNDQANRHGPDGPDSGLEGGSDDPHLGWQSAGSDEVERNDATDAGSLTHAQPEEDQQADGDVGADGIGAVDAMEPVADVHFGQPDFVDDSADIEIADAPLQTPDERTASDETGAGELREIALEGEAGWDAGSDTGLGERYGEESELAEPENAEAELTEPREYTEDEIAELEREWRARRGLPAPSEAAE